jgi:UDP-2,3-diacylglucosamine pyrophosphatase LpxH
MIKNLFISDVHLGSKTSSAESLLFLIEDLECENLYIVGDFLDFWSLKRKRYWPQSHNDVVQKILRMSRKGTKVHYIIGNHDENIRDYLPLSLGNNITFMDETVFELGDKKYWVIHGDAFDNIVKYHKWVAVFGDIAYHVLTSGNKYVNYFRRIFNLPYWSLSKYVKSKVKGAVNFIGEYEKTVSQACKDRGYDGVICGHIHQPVFKMIDGIEYWNIGDFCESCTYIIEDKGGKLKIMGIQ